MGLLKTAAKVAAALGVLMVLAEGAVSAGDPLLSIVPAPA